MKEKVEANADLGRLSRKLAEIKIDCDVTFDAQDFEMCPPDATKVQELFEELEFRRLKDQFLKLYSGEAETGTQASHSQTEKKSNSYGVKSGRQRTIYPIRW